MVLVKDWWLHCYPLDATARTAKGGMNMNTFQVKNNIYKNGEYKPDNSKAMLKEKARDIVPTSKQVKYRNDLYDFCIQKGIVREGFSLFRTKQGITSNIRALLYIVKKNGLIEEFVARNAKQPEVEE